jgi:hypothetical protein
MVSVVEVVVAVTVGALATEDDVIVVAGVELLIEAGTATVVIVATACLSEPQAATVSNAKLARMIGGRRCRIVSPL